MLFPRNLKMSSSFDQYSVLFTHWSTQSGPRLPIYLLASGGSTVSHHHLLTLCGFLLLLWSSECYPVMQCATWLTITAVSCPSGLLESMYQMSLGLQQSLPNFVISLLSVWLCTITHVYVNAVYTVIYLIISDMEYPLDLFANHTNECMNPEL